MIGLVTSCKTIYRPSFVQTPVFDEKGQLDVDVIVGSAGGELHAGYAISNKFAITGMLQYDVSRVTVRDTLYGISDGNSNYENYSTELALNYYKWLDRDSTWYFSLIAGGGIGKTSGFSDRWYNPDFVGYDAKYSRYFWQIFSCYRTKYADLFGATRLRFHNYSMLNSHRGDIFNPGVDTFIEPMIGAKIGGEQFKLVLQFGTSVSMQPIPSYDTSKLIFGAGFHLKIKKQKSSAYDYLE